MIINARHTEECRVAVVDNGLLTSFRAERAGAQSYRGNIYKAVVTRVEPSLQAVFMNFGRNKNGFLSFRDIHPTYFRCSVPKDNPYKADILKAVMPGQEMVVQIVREERDSKGSTLTTYLSIPGSYTVLLPGVDTRSISQKIDDIKQRQRFKKILSELEIPEGLGLIIRTAGEGRTKTEIKQDLARVLRLWGQIKENVVNSDCPAILHEESDIAISMLRDYTTNEVQEVIIDNKDLYDRLKGYLKTVMPRYVSRLRLYREDTPIFERYCLESQVDEINSARVSLDLGGFLIINRTEAMVTVDVNSGRFKSTEDIEDTAYKINIEAARAIARQLTLRDLGGIVAIDFIDMRLLKHRNNVEKELRNAFTADKARRDFTKINKFGVLVMSRQRLGSSTEQIFFDTCPHCQGKGLVISPAAQGLHFLRIAETRAAVKSNYSSIEIMASKSVASYLLNQKREQLLEFEKKFLKPIFVRWSDDLSNNQGKVTFLNENNSGTSKSSTFKSSTSKSSTFKNSTFKSSTFKSSTS
jgi:ribonuclease E